MNNSYFCRLTYQRFIHIFPFFLQSQDNEYVTFTAKTQYEGCLILELVTKDAKECAKLAGMMLMHYGYLRRYDEGAKPEIIEVSKPGLCVQFNVWFSTRTEGGNRINVVVTEAVFVKRVGCSLG